MHTGKLTANLSEINRKMVNTIWLTEIVGCVPLTNMQTPPPSEVVEILWKVRSVLNWTGKIIKKFSNFYFLSYHRKLGDFFTKKTISKNKNRKNLVFLSIQPIADLSSKLKKINFEENQIFPIFIFWVMSKKNVAGNSGMPLSVNLLKVESSILPRVKRASSETT